MARWNGGVWTESYFAGRPVHRESATMAQRDMDEGGRKIDMEQICVEAARPGRRESLG
jgi:hypothetical protein